MRRLPVILAFLLFALHLAILGYFSVDLPVMDEWGMLQPGGVDHRLNWAWLFTAHNEHHILPARVAVQLSYWLNAWDNRLLCVASFLLFGAGVAWLVRKTHQLRPELPLGLLAMTAAFLFAPSAMEGHIYATLITFHFYWISLFAAIFLLFDERQSPPRMVAGAALLLLSMLSFGSGAPSAACVAAVFALWKALRRQVAGGAAVLFSVAIALGLLFLNFKHPAGHPAWMLPDRWEFWAFFANLISLSMGFQTRSLFVALPLMLGVLGVAWLNLSRRLDAGSWAISTAILAVLAALASVAMSRAGFGLEHSKAGRYITLCALLLPWVLVGVKDRRVAYAFFALCFVGYLDNWSYRGYREVYQLKTEAVECVARYYKGLGPPECPTVYPNSLKVELDRAKALGVSFTRH